MAAEKSKKQTERIERKKETGEVVYKCAQCSYVLYKKSKESPPTFCPNCAVNHLKGKMIRLKRF